MNENSDAQQKDRELFDRIALNYSKKDIYPVSRTVRKFQIDTLLNLLAPYSKQTIFNNIIELGDDFKYNLTLITSKYGVEMGGISKAKYAEKLAKRATVSKVAGNFVKVLTPILEAPNSWEQYKYMAEGGYTSLAVISTVGDAVSYGHLRSIAKIPSLLRFTPLMSDEQADKYEKMINKNINGINIQKQVKEKLSYVHDLVTK